MDLSATRPCLRKRKAECAARWDMIARYAGQRSPEWIGRRLGMTADQVNRFMERHGCGPTTRDDLLTSGYVADLLGCTQQWVVRLVKAGKLRGWRNPGGCRGNKSGRRWWLISRHSVQQYLAEHGKPADHVLLTEPSGWPQVKIARRGGKNDRLRSAATLPRALRGA